MSQSPEKNSEGLIGCLIYSDGSKINDSFSLISVWIRKEVNQIGIAHIVLEAGNMPEQEIPESEDETFAPGKNIRIEAGYKNSEKVIFEGIISAHSVDIDDTDTTLIIECLDFAYPMTLSRKNEIFENKKDTEIIQEIVGKYAGLTATVDATAIKYKELVQYYCSDWDFIKSRASLNGLLILTEGKKIQVKSPDFSAAPLFTVTYGKDMIAFKGNLQTEGQMDEVEASAWDSSKQQIIQAKGVAPKLNKQGTQSPKQLANAVGHKKNTLQTNSIEDENMLKSWANAELLKAGLSRISGEVTFQGNADVKLGSMLTLAGLSKRFNGQAYISMVEHEIKEGLWRTTTGIGIPAEVQKLTPRASAPTAAGLIPSIQGMHVGKVVKIDEDPDKENRIQVEVPLLNEGKNKIWARLATFWASNQYGAFFIPDIGDEVVLGFFNNDPSYPVILGSLYSSKQPPAAKIQAENNIRSIVTKSKLKIEFEEQKKIITLITPGNNTIEISDQDKSIKIKDQNKNLIEMNDSGIVINSAKSITFKAKTNIKIEAGANIDVKAATALNLKGANIKAEADISFAAKGSANAELTAGGQTVIKGALVMIN